MQLYLPGHGTTWEITRHGLHINYLYINLFINLDLYWIYDFHLCCAVFVIWTISCKIYTFYVLEREHGGYLVLAYSYIVCS